MIFIAAMREKFDRFVGVEADGKGVPGLFYLFVGALLASVLVIIVAVTAAIKGYAELGSFGDFIGGTLNPVLTFLTFMGLLITIVLQQTELRESREELRRSATALESQLKALDRQNFESTFFQMLALHNSIVNAMDYSPKPGGVLHGRDCFRHFFTSFANIYNRNETKEEPQRIINAHRSFWRDMQQDLGHYYRYLYNVIRFIDESDVEKARYIRIIRAQLSDYELLVLFYNGLTPKATRFKTYIERYGLFDNLPTDLILQAEHFDLYEESAFNESVAWEKLTHTLTDFIRSAGKLKI